MTSTFGSFDASALGARVQSSVDPSAFGDGNPGTLYGIDSPDVRGYDVVAGTSALLTGLPAATADVDDIALIGGQPWAVIEYDDGVDHERRVYRYTGSTWVQVGDISAYGLRRAYIADVDGTAYLYVVANLFSTDGALLSSTGGAWSVVASALDRRTGTWGHLRGAGGEVWFNADDGTVYTMYRYESGAWVANGAAEGDIDTGLYSTGRLGGAPGLRFSDDGGDTWSDVAVHPTSTGITSDDAAAKMRLATGAGGAWFFAESENNTAYARLANYSGGTASFDLGQRSLTPGADLVLHGGRLYTNAGIARQQIRTGAVATVDATPANNTFRVTVAGQFEEVAGNASVEQTAADLVDALNASAQSNIAAITWANPSGGTITATVDVAGDSLAPVFSVSGAGTGSVTAFSITQSNVAAGLHRWNSGTSTWVQVSTDGVSKFAR